MSGGGRIEANVYLKMTEHTQEVKTLCKPFTAKDLIQAIEDVTSIPEKISKHNLT